MVLLYIVTKKRKKSFRLTNLPSLGIQNNGHWPVIDQGDLHICSKFARLDGNCLSQFLVELVVEGGGQIRLGRPCKSWPIALFGIRIEGELGDGQDLTAHILDRQIHLVRII